MNLIWTVIGGGIHGVHIAARLIGEGNVAPEHIRIIDPGERLLARWHACTRTTGMTHLRSPAVHNLDLSPWSLMQFADAPLAEEQERFAAPYNRPNLTMFNEHCEQVIQSFKLSSLHVRARALRCSIGCDNVTVELSGGTEITTSNVILAVGASEQPFWPGWVPPDKQRVHHIFAPDFHEWPSQAEDVVVVGGGISAAQVALRLANEGHQVQMISRHPLREHQFDSDPGWLGPRYMDGFAREQDIEKRRLMITNARHRGSVPPDVGQALRDAFEAGQITWHDGAVAGAQTTDAGLILRLETGKMVTTERVLLATGFSGRRPGGTLVDQLVASASLPCATCGYPIVDESLRWHPRVYVAGPLAELELGPVARNIAGARQAARRLLAAASA